MNECKTVRTLLALRPGDWSAGERHRVKIHLETCPDCAAQAQAYAIQDRLIRALPRSSLTAAQRGHVLSRAQNESRWHPARAKLRTVLSMAGAAVILVALTVGLYTLLQGSDQLEVGAPLRSEEPLIASQALTFAGEVQFNELSVESAVAKTISPTSNELAAGVVPMLESLFAPGDVVLSSTWQIVAEPSADWRVFLHLTNETGELVMQSDADVDWPTRPCSKGEFGSQCLANARHLWTLPAGFPPGVYTISVGLYDPVTDARAPVTNPLGEVPSMALAQVVIAESTVFAGEIRALESRYDATTGRVVPFVLGEPEEADPSAPGRLSPPASVRFQLDWQVIAPVSAAWRVFAHLVDEAGQTVMQSDISLDWPAYPCPEVASGMGCITATEHEWFFPAEFPSGLYSVVVGLYDPATGMRAPADPPSEASSIGLGQVRVLSAEPTSKLAQVTLRIFSGRPNPEWSLSPTQDAELAHRLAVLPSTEQAYDQGGGLGYTGFHIAMPAVENQPAGLVDVWEGIVRLETADGSVLLADTDRALERWLLDTAAGKVEETLVEEVRGELNTSLPATGFGLFLLNPEPSVFDSSELNPSGLELDDTPIISLDDIVTYRWDTHEIELTESAFERIAQLEVPTAPGVPFVVCVDREPIYRGEFWTPASSAIYDGVVILVPSIADRPAIQMRLGYPSPVFFSGEDPRGDPRIFESLEAAGKIHTPEPVPSPVP